MKVKVVVFYITMLCAYAGYGQEGSTDTTTEQLVISTDTTGQLESTETTKLEQALQSEAPEYHPIDKQTWQEEKEGMHFNEKSEPQELPDQTPIDPDEEIEPLISSDLIKIIAFISIAVLLFFILYRIFGKGLRANPGLQTSTTEILDDLDERPMESDLDRYLKQALTAKDYRLAVRIYYLMLLKALHDKNIITWRKEKTNYDYLRELQKHPEIKRLNNSTLLFEYIWYGDKAVNESEFHGIQPGFISLIDQIRKG